MTKSNRTKITNPKKILKPIQFTREGYEDVKQQYAHLQTERKGAVETLAAARAMGDLSENGLYSAAKAKLRSIDSQLFRLEMMLKLGHVQEVPTKHVGIGSKVTIEINAKSKKEVTIVGNYEADPLSGKISSNSPIGKALLGRKTGDKIEVEVPAGKNFYKILKIQS